MDGKDAPDCLTVQIISGKPEAIIGVIPVTSGEKSSGLFCCFVFMVHMMAPLNILLHKIIVIHNNQNSSPKYKARILKISVLLTCSLRRRHTSLPRRRS